jgi:hypothetical protein
MTCVLPVTTLSPVLTANSTSTCCPLYSLPGPVCQRRLRAACQGGWRVPGQPGRLGNHVPDPSLCPYYSPKHLSYSSKKSLELLPQAEALAPTSQRRTGLGKGCSGLSGISQLVSLLPASVRQSSWGRGPLGCQCSWGSCARLSGNPHGSLRGNCPQSHFTRGWDTA